MQAEEYPRPRAAAITPECVADMEIPSIITLPLLVAARPSMPQPSENALGGPRGRSNARAIAEAINRAI